MTNQSYFTKGQWAAAAGIALALHILLAWSLLSSIPVLSDTPSGQDGGLAVQSLSLSGADLPLLQGTAAGREELAVVTAASPIDAISRPLPPPEARPMTEVVPFDPERPLIEKPKSKTTQQRARKAEKPRPTRKPLADDTEGRNLKGDSSRAGQGSKGGRGVPGAAGSSRAAAPLPGNPHPRYPRVARSNGHEGRVLIRVSVLGNGRVGSATIAKSSGHGSLDRAALEAVKRWRFAPALRAGKPVTATLTVPVVFRLEG
jgi:protein TonB